MMMIMIMMVMVMIIILKMKMITKYLELISSIFGLSNYPASF